MRILSRQLGVFLQIAPFTWRFVLHLPVVQKFVLHIQVSVGGGKVASVFFLSRVTAGKAGRVAQLFLVTFEPFPVVVYVGACLSSCRF